jgi:quercetin dioxygenase-like cupin family protein
VKRALHGPLALLALSLCVDASSGRAGESAVHARAADAKLQWGPCPPVFPKGCEIAVLHGDPAADNADVFLRVPGGYAIPPHRHTSAERMVLIAGELEVTYAGHAPFTMTVGSYAYGPARLPHEARCIGTETCVLSIAFETPVDAELAALTK